MIPSEKMIAELDAGQKWCKGCQQYLPCDDFYRHTTKGLTRHATLCKECTKAKARRYYQTTYKAVERERQRQKYKQQCKAQDENIILEHHCDICSAPGARYFWRDRRGRDFSNFVVLHSECFSRAVEEGLLQANNVIRHKDSIRGKK